MIKKIHKFYSLAFGYKRPFDERSSRSLLRAEQTVEDMLAKSGLVYLHQYSWPDGSLLKWIRTEKTSNEVRSIIEDGLNGVKHVWLRDIEENEPTINPWKYGYKTLADYFAGEKSTE